MAGGVVSALAAQGLAGKVPVSGQDGDAPALNRIALGLQTVDVWKDARLLGTAAGNAAVQMCGGVARTDLPNVGTFHTPGGLDVSAYLLQPQPINVSNLNTVLDAGWISKATLCQGVPAGTVAVCS
jgi:D-xylose transport system substrate-binding protein